jgi:hypothetical protein
MEQAPLCPVGEPAEGLDRWPDFHFSLWSHHEFGGSQQQRSMSLVPGFTSLVGFDSTT